MPIGGYPGEELATHSGYQPQFKFKDYLKQNYKGYLKGIADKTFRKQEKGRLRNEYKTSPAYQFGQATNTGDVSSLIQSQINAASGAEQKTLADRQKAIDAIMNGSSNATAGIKDVQGIIKNQLGNVSPLVQSLRGSIQNILDNPNLMSDVEKEKLRTTIENRVLRTADEGIGLTRSDMASRGLSGSGLSSQATGDIYRNAGVDIGEQIAALEMQLAQGRSDRLSNTQQIGSSLESALQSGNTDLLRLLSDLGVDLSNIENNKGNTLANIYANTQYDVPDYSGLAGLALQQRDAFGQQEQFASEMQLLKDQLSNQNNQFYAQLQALLGGQ